MVLLWGYAKTQDSILPSAQKVCGGGGGGVWVVVVCNLILAFSFDQAEQFETYLHNIQIEGSNCTLRGSNYVANAHLVK